MESYDSDNEETKEQKKEVIYEQIVTKEDMEWFYKSDIMPSPEFLDSFIVDMHPYY